MATSNFGIFPGPFSEPLDYYSPGLISSEYRLASPNMNLWLRANLQLFQDQIACLAQMLVAYNLNLSASVATVSSSVMLTQTPTNPTWIPSNSATQALQVASVAGIFVGMTATLTIDSVNLIPVGTVVTGISGNVVFLSQPPFQALAQVPVTFSLVPAVGAQLDVIGAIVGQSRSVAFQPSGSTSINGVTVANGGSGYVVGDIVGVTQSGAFGGQLQITSVSLGVVTGLALVAGAQGTGYSVATGLSTTGGSGTGLTVNITAVGSPSPVLDDDTYRILLQCKIGINHWNGQISNGARSIQGYFAGIFPGGSITIQDNQNMTATVTIGATLSSVMQDLISNGYVVAKPMGVKYTYVGSASLPYFGVDQNNSQVAGADLGHVIA